MFVHVAGMDVSLLVLLVIASTVTGVVALIMLLFNDRRDL